MGQLFVEPDMYGSRYIRSVELPAEQIPDRRYPFNIPAIRHLGRLPLHPRATFFVGENGTGKSTLTEAIAALVDLNPEGGSKHHRFETRASESRLKDYLRIQRGIMRETDGFFLRAEGMYNVATSLEELGISPSSYGGVPLHSRSHGEAFLAVAIHRFRGNGLYVMDEPESALSPRRQIEMVKRIHLLAETKNSQFIIATHSPILLSYPQSVIYQFDNDGISEVEYDETEIFRTMRDFTSSADIFLHHLLGDLSFD